MGGRYHEVVVETALRGSNLQRPGAGRILKRILLR